MTKPASNYLLPSSLQEGGTVQVALRCPHCRHQGVFTGKGKDVYTSFPTGWVNYGVRTCPRRDCEGIVFVVALRQGDGTAVVLHSYPPETVDWDATGLPPHVLDAFQEAIRCEANECYRASALMTRRTLELVCDDQGAAGPTLVKRLQALGQKAVLPEALLLALDDLRLLGNDAAHVDARDYEEVGQTEVRLALDVAKELLKAVYQLDSLMSRLAAFKKKRE
ncbi:DUF4145 domain-containing protein [Modestobacter versicolor]|uniref:DUF4145 domain-containing protein n=1 Tax=Modestobacter versicolor TaxID=429133 RepID=A0A323VBW0_9ACTN|nr:DUF4145 domain-containing protein [Modestobacter versicolor]MBB3676220.1 hypothetical protein [Modestobacter versicolor]PZA22324.1 hypothetical protein DMO24_05620 [Modestobacter versicolor]